MIWLLAFGYAFAVIAAGLLIYVAAIWVVPLVVAFAAGVIGWVSERWRGEK